MSGKRVSSKAAAHAEAKRRKLMEEESDEEVYQDSDTSDPSSSEPSSGTSSDDDGDDDVLVFDDGFDDELHGDEADREWLDALEPLKREEELARRYQARAIKKELFMVKQAQRKREEELARGKQKASGRKAAAKKAAAKPKRAVKKGTKAKTVTVLSSDDDADEDYKGGRRAGAGGRRVLPGRAGRATAAAPSDDGSESEGVAVSSDDESEYSDDGNIHAAKNRIQTGAGRKKPAGRRRAYSSASEDDAELSEDPEAEAQRRAEEAEPVPLDLINSCRLSRASLVKHRDEPYFKRMIGGMFVRLVTQPRTYVMAQIAGRESIRSYKVDGMRTTTALHCRIGPPKTGKSFRLSQVSNAEITEEEFRQYRKQLDKLESKMVTATWLRKRRSDSKFAKSQHKYTEEEIMVLVEKRQADIRSVPNITQLKLKTEQQQLYLEGQLEDAQEAVDMELMASLQKQLDSVRQRLSLINLEAARRDRRKTEADEKITVTATINKNAAKYNKSVVHEVFKREVEAAKNIAAAKQEDQANPFHRRRCAPELLWSVKGVNDDETPEAAEAKAKAEAEAKEAEEAAAATATNGAGGTDDAAALELSVVRRSRPTSFAMQQLGAGGAEDVVAAIVQQETAKARDAAGVVDVPAPLAGVGSLVPAPAPAAPASGKKKLSLAAYRKRKQG